MGGYKYRVFLRKRPVLQSGVRLQGVSVRRGSTVYRMIMNIQDYRMRPRPRNYLHYTRSFQFQYILAKCLKMGARNFKF